MLYPILISIAFLYAAIYMMCEQGQRYFYDRTVDGLWYRVAAAAIPLGLFLAYVPLSLNDMVERVHLTLLHAFAWFLAFWLACGFQRGHAAVVGPAGYLVSSWAVCLAIDSLVNKAAAP